MSKPIYAIMVRRRPGWLAKVLGVIAVKEVWVAIHHKGNKYTWAKVPVDRAMKISKSDGVKFVHAIDKLVYRIFAIHGKPEETGRKGRAA